MFKIIKDDDQSVEVLHNDQSILYWDKNTSADDLFESLCDLLEDVGEKFVAFSDGEMEDEPLICGVCMGSSEGAYEGTTCYQCRGTGLERRED